MIKHLIITVFFFATVIGAVAKKDKQPDVDVATWAKEQSMTLPAVVDGVKMFRPNNIDADEKIRITGFVDMPAINKVEAFTAAVITIANDLDKEFETIDNLDFDNARFIVSRSIVDGEGRSSATYNFKSAYQFDDEIMSFSIYDINIEYKEKGLIPRKLPIEKLKPAKNQRHKELIEGMSFSSSQVIDKIQKYAKENPHILITHWKEIKDHKVVKGMTQDEVTLIGGKPRSVSQSGEREQWVFSNDFIVIFNNGVVSNVIQ